MNKIKTTKKFWAYIALFAVVLIWSLSPIVSNMKVVKSNYSPGMIIALRSVFATIALLLINVKKLKKINKNYFKVAVPSGLILATATLCQMIGYRYEAAPGETAFLENVSVVIIPIFLFLFTRKKPSWMKIGAAVLCFVGSAIIALAGSKGNVFSVSLGKWLAIIAGVMYGVNIAVTGVFTKKLDLDSGLYVFIQLFIQSLAAFGYSIIGEKLLMAEGNVFQFTFQPLPLITVAVLGIVATGICWTLRTHCFKHINVMFVSIVMPFSLVLTGVWSIIGGMETLTWNLAVGGCIILMAILLADLGDKLLEKHKLKKQAAELPLVEEVAITCESTKNIENKENKE